MWGRLESRLDPFRVEPRDIALVFGSQTAGRFPRCGLTSIPRHADRCSVLHFVQPIRSLILLSARTAAPLSGYQPTKPRIERSYVSFIFIFIFISIFIRALTFRNVSLPCEAFPIVAARCTPSRRASRLLGEDSSSNLFCSSPCEFNLLRLFDARIYEVLSPTFAEKRRAIKNVSPLPPPESP